MDCSLFQIGFVFLTHKITTTMSLMSIQRNFSIFNDKLSGLTKGFYIFAGESNGGKTAIMSNLLKDYGTTAKNNLFAIYYTLDDTVGEVIPRIIAMDQNIPIAVAAKPKRYEKFAAITPRTPDEEFNIEQIREQLRRRKGKC